MNETRKITIKSVQLLKTGISQKTGRAWNLFIVEDNANNKYKTFSNAYQNKIGQEIEVTLEKKEKEFNGTKYVDYFIIDRQKSQAEIRHEEIKKILKAVWDKLLTIEDKLNNH